MKTRDKTKRDLFRVDFLTAYTVEQCRDILQRETVRMAPDWQRIFLRDDDSFVIERLVTLPLLLRVEGENGIEVRFRGTLDAVEKGTRVHGTIMPDTLERYRQARLVMDIGGVLAAITGAIIILIEAWLVLLALGLITLPLWAFMTWRWREIRWYPLELTHWIRHQLESDETQA
jgi:hypothetical protein